MDAMITVDDLVDGTFVQRMALAEGGLVGLEIAPGGHVATLRDDVFRQTVSAGFANHPVAIGDTLLFDDRAGVYVTVSKEDVDGTVSPYIAPADTDVMSLATDGVWLAWLEGRTRLTSSTHWATMTIKVAPFDPNPAALLPTTLIELGEGLGSTIGIGGGWVILDRQQSGRYVKLAVNIETAEQRTLVPPDGFYFGEQPLYVTEDEVAFPLVQLVTGIHRTIWRMSLSD